MDSFAFMIHPLEVTDISKKFPMARHIPNNLMERFLRMAPPFKAATIEGMKSPRGEVKGNLITCPLTTNQIMGLPEEVVLKKISQTAKMAQKMGAKLLGLGAFTKVVGDAGITVARNLDIPVTTGNSYTIATAIEGVREAAKLMGIDLNKAQVVIIGATGSIGRACAELIGRDISYLTLVARDTKRLDALANRLLFETGISAKITSNIKSALAKADVVITVTNAIDTVIQPEDLKSGCIVCDVARPRDVSRQVAQSREDVLVIEGGLVEIPEHIKINLNFGLPRGLVYACMAETMILALEGKYESFSLGREITPSKVLEISRLAVKHGFKLAKFRSFERTLCEEDIIRIKNNALSAMG